jgi:hypothetical protein
MVKSNVPWKTDVRLRSPVIAHTVGTGFRDLKVVESLWFHKQRDRQKLILSGLERRWLFEGVSARNSLKWRQRLIDIHLN